MKKKTIPDHLNKLAERIKSAFTEQRGAFQTLEDQKQDKIILKQDYIPYRWGVGEGSFDGSLQVAKDSAEASAVVQRTSEGKIFIADGTADGHAVTKKQLDTKLDKLNPVVTNILTVTHESNEPMILLKSLMPVDQNHTAFIRHRNADNKTISSLGFSYSGVNGSFDAFYLGLGAEPWDDILFRVKSTEFNSYVPLKSQGKPVATTDLATSTANGLMSSAMFSKLNGLYNMVYLTESAYAALGTKDPNTLYIRPKE